MRDESNRIKPGAEVVVSVERILPGGLGLAHAQGKTLFVALSAPDDRVRVRVDQIRGKIAFASIVEIVEPSTGRVRPPCVYFGRCGGCDFQQLNYEAQLSAKVEIIRDCLRRIAHIDFQDQIPITPSPNPWQYRSSAQWKYDPLKSHLGYFERGSHTVCDVVECPILVPALQDTLHSLHERLTQETLSADAREFEVVAGDDGVSIFPPIGELDTRDVGRNIGGDRYVFSADSFFQINQELLPSLIDAAIGDARGETAIGDALGENAIGDARGETAIDLYCGVGLFTLPLARRFARVIGVEGNLIAAEYARRNLSNANLDNASIEPASVGEWLEANANSLVPVDFVLLDPPRAGAEKGVIEAIVTMRPSRITYASCDPATLARDLKTLLDHGYALDSVAAFDMFPQTHHVETVARLSEKTGPERAEKIAKFVPTFQG